MNLKGFIIILSIVYNALAVAQEEDRCIDAAVAIQVSTPVAIDGDLSEWNATHPLAFNREEQVLSMGLWNGWDDFSAVAYVMWDNHNLYLAAEIADDMPFKFLNTPQIDGVDALTLYLNTNSSEDCERDLFSSTDFRVLFALDNNRFPTGIDRNAVLLKKGFQTKGMDGDASVLDGYEVAVKTINKGYQLELKLPFSALANDRLPVFEPEIGMCTCFNLQFIDLDEASEDEVDSIGNRVSYITFFPGEPIARPGDWGYLKFK